MKNLFLVTVMLFFTIIFVSNLGFSNQIYISEISFIDEDFIEIYSDNQINLTNNFFFDSVGSQKSNTLISIKTKESKYSIIVGESFLNQYDISNLNCSIYSTQTSNPGYYGLKSSGESFTIQINQTLNLSFNKTQSYSFKTNETLNKNLSNQNFEIRKKSICQKDLSIFLNQTQNSSQRPLINQSNIINPQEEHYKIQIIPTKDVFENKLEFKFETNQNNFQIEYWVEDFQNYGVKSKRNTTNTNKKTYSPRDKTALYYIKANLYINQTLRNSTSKIVYFYFNESQNIEESQINCDFDIISKDLFFEPEKITFTVNSNIENLSYNYQFQDIYNNSLTSLKTSSTKKTKQFTPKSSFGTIYKIQTQVLTPNCQKNISKYVYYQFQNQSNSSQITNIEGGSTSNLVKNCQNSYIKVLNQGELELNLTNIVEFELCRTQISKKTVNFYLNSKKLNTIYLEKDSKIKGKLNLNQNYCGKKLKIEGLNQLQEINLCPPEFTSDFKIAKILESTQNSVQNTQKEYFNLTLLSFTNTHLNFKINTNLNNLDLECYTTNLRTRTSVKLEKQNTSIYNKSRNFNLILKEKTILRKLNNSKLSLILTCKYKKSNLKTFKTQKLEFEYFYTPKIQDILTFQTKVFNTFNQTNKILNSTNILQSQNTQLQQIDTQTLLLNNIELKQESKTKLQTPKNHSTNYISNNEKIKQNSFFGIFLGVLTLSILMILFW